MVCKTTLHSIDFHCMDKKIYILCSAKEIHTGLQQNLCELKVEGETTPFWASYLKYVIVFPGLLPYIALIKLINRSALDICCAKYIALSYITQFNDK